MNVSKNTMSSPAKKKERKRGSLLIVSYSSVSIREAYSKETNRKCERDKVKAKVDC
jgi:hypothetical protein